MNLNGDPEGKVSLDPATIPALRRGEKPLYFRL
jgi:hypothetical protein